MKQLLQALANRHAALDASDTGTGKTWVACAIAKLLDVTPIVICPKGTIPSWHKAGEAFKIEVEAINYELVRFTKEGIGKWGNLVPHGKGSYWRWHSDYEFGIFDEVHRCAGLSTINSKLLKAAHRQWGFVLGLSATAAESVLDMNALGLLLGLHDGKNFVNWLLKRGCKPAIFGKMPYVPEDRADGIIERLSNEIFPARGSRMRREEIPGFPKTQIERLVLTSTDEVLKNAAWARAAVDNGDKMVWQQSMQALERLAVPEILELAQQYRETSRVMIFCNYVQTVDMLVAGLEKLGSVGFIDGRQQSALGTAQRHEFLCRFQADNLDFLVANSDAGGIGLNAHGKEDRTTLVLPNFSGKSLAQLLGRVHRDGGGWSLQLLCAFEDTWQETAVLTAISKLDKISMLNDKQLFGL